MAALRDMPLYLPTTHMVARLAILACLALVIAAAAIMRPVVAADTAYVIDIDGPIGPAVEDHIARGFEAARASGASVIVLRIDTPGGLVSSTRGIIKTILASDRPVIGFVSPPGSRAASAGAYILLACHVAVMAPGTNVGSATPVMLGGGPPGGNPGGTPASEKDEHPDITDKVINDARAYMRSISEMRGRPGDAAEKFVSEALNYTAAEALKLGLIDLMADGMRDMLEKLDGRTIKLGDEDHTLATRSLDVEAFERTWRDDLLVFITNPNIAYLLLMAGIYGLVIEFSNPGLIAPGIIGGVCLILGMYALQLLPINYAGLALIALGLALMAAEAFVPSFGVFGIGGVVAFIIGSIMLIDSDVPELEISPVLIGTVSLATGALFLFVLTFAVRAWRRPAVSGNAAMLGETARVLRWQDGAGTVLAHGETWAAVGDAGLARDDRVLVKQIDGLTVTVEADNGRDANEGTSDA